VPKQSLRSKRDDECDGLAGNQKDHQHRCNNGRRSGVQSNTERTVIGVGIDGVNVCYLDEGEESQQGQAEHNDGSPGIGQPVPIATRPWVKSSQSNVYLELRSRFWVMFNRGEAVLATSSTRIHKKQGYRELDARHPGM
jgi:hypothetical protein